MRRFPGSLLLLPGALVVAGVLAFGIPINTPGGMLLGTRPLQGTRIEGATFPKRLIDPAGFVLAIPAPPQRIVSIVLAGDQILTALVPPERLAGVTYLVDTPEVSNLFGIIPATVPRLHTEVETILSLQPDLVVVAGYTRAETIRFLVAAGIPVVRFQGYDSFHDIIANIHTLAAAVGAEPQATQLVAMLQQRLDSVARRVHGRACPRVLSYADGGYTAGSGSLIDEMITRAGGCNVIREVGLQGATQLSLEMALSLQPEVILTESWSPTSGDAAIRLFLDDPRWQHVPAIQQRRIYAIPGGWLTAVSQYAVQALEAIAWCLHPEAFAS